MGAIRAARRFAVDSSDPAYPTIRTTAFIGGDPRGLTFGQAQDAVLRSMRTRKFTALEAIDAVKALRQRTDFEGYGGPTFVLTYGSDPTFPQITTLDQAPGFTKDDGLLFGEAKRRVIAHHRAAIRHADDISRGIRSLTAGAVDAIERAEFERTAGAGPRDF